MAGLAPACHRLPSDALIEIDHVTFGYDERRTILADISLTVGDAEFVGILGHNGILTPAQIADVTAYLVSPESPLNKK